MKWLLALTLLAYAAQTTEPAPFPPGQFCEHMTAQQPHPAHACACQRECKPDTEAGPDGTLHDTVRVQEDPQCKQYCTASHCHCPVKGCD
jgi:hypothetical protein